MIVLFCSWFLLQITLSAEECPGHCHSSTFSGNPCCICKLLEECRVACKINKNLCYACLHHFRQDVIANCSDCRGYSNVFGECSSCPDKCVLCLDNTFCYECVQGMYGFICNERCGKCKPDNQGIVKCDIDSGICASGCMSGWYGDTCQEICSYTCSERSCNPKTGYCDNDCVSGWYGDSCNITCSGTCSDMSCSKKTGHCNNKCASGWYGDTCKQSCSHTCYDKACDQYSGHCDHGCVHGYYGDTCEFGCLDTCKRNVCDRETSECLEGCARGYEGTFCNTTRDTSHDSILVGLTGSLAGAIISLVFVMILWISRRMILRGKCYNNVRNSNRETSVPVYDEISDTNGITVERRVTASHTYMEVGTSHNQRSAHVFGEANTQFGVGTVVESMNDISHICASDLNMCTLHSEAGKYNNSDGDETPVCSLISPGIHRERSNETNKYYEISDITDCINLNTVPDENRTSDHGYEIPISNANTSCQNGEFHEADNTTFSIKCNDIAKNSKSKSNKTHNKDLKPTTNREMDAYECKLKQEVDTTVIHETNTNLAINEMNSTDVTEHIETNQIQQKRGKGKCNTDQLESDIDIHLQKPEIQNKANDGDTESVNYIHPVI